MADIQLPEGAVPATVGDVLGKPAGAVVVMAKNPVYSPWAFHFKMKLRATQESLVKAFDPKGAEPKQLARIKAYVLDLIAGLPESCNAVEVKIEARITAGADDAKVIVFNHEI